jgi:hypothetical protein
VLEDGPDQSRAFRHQSLAPGEDDCVGSNLVGEREDPIARHPHPNFEADVRVIAVSAAELGGPGLDFVLGLICERWQRLLGQDVHDDDLGTADACRENDRFHGRGCRHDGLERDKDPAETDRDLAVRRHDHDRLMASGRHVFRDVACWPGPTRRCASPHDDRHDVRPSSFMDDSFERPT